MVHRSRTSGPATPDPAPPDPAPPDRPAALPLHGRADPLPPRASRPPHLSQSPGLAQPPRCDIVVVRTTTMSHRRGSASCRGERHEADVTGVAQISGFRAARGAGREHAVQSAPRTPGSAGGTVALLGGEGRPAEELLDGQRGGAEGDG